MSERHPEGQGPPPQADAAGFEDFAEATTTPDAQPDPMLTSRLGASLLEALDEFAAHEQVLVALDFDGTLAPLVDDPRDSRMLEASAGAVERLTQLTGVTLAIVSGRAALDLAEVAGLPDDTIVIGSHGAQLGRIRDAGGRTDLIAEPMELDDRQRELLEEVTRRLEAIVAATPGARIELKPAAAVLHTRGIDEESADAATREALDGPGALEGVRAIHGKDVVEIGVLDVNKGDGVYLLKERAGATAALYVGDDTTDEDAFAVLTEDDLGVKVGGGDTRAGYRVESPAEVSMLLLELVSRRESPPDV